MVLPFNYEGGLIVVNVKTTGPKGTVVLQLALDTGATLTLVDEDLLRAIGYAVDASTDLVQMATGSGMAVAPRIIVDEMTLFEVTRRNTAVLAYSLPTQIKVDGLLGLNFFEGCLLEIDFTMQEISLIQK